MVFRTSKGAHAWFGVGVYAEDDDAKDDFRSQSYVELLEILTAQNHVAWIWDSCRISRELVVKYSVGLCQ